MHLLSCDAPPRYHEQVSFERGEIVEGTVIQFEPTGALIDIGAKATAYMPAREVQRSDPTPTLQRADFLLRAYALGFLVRIMLCPFGWGSADHYSGFPVCRARHIQESQQWTGSACCAAFVEVVFAGTMTAVSPQSV